MSPPLICEIFSIFVLAIIFFQDMRDRAVSWLLFPLLGACFVIRFLYVSGDFTYPVFNYSFIIIQVAAVALYVFVRYRSTGILTHYLGIGDILYWVVIAWVFSPVNFILYHLAGLIFSLVVYA